MKKFKMDIPKHIQLIMERLKEKGFKSYIVGGAVRNSYLGMPAKDFDISTNASIEEMINDVFHGEYKIINPNGIKHGTITLRYHHDNIEITEFKAAGENPRTLNEDSNHRDFTINSLYYNNDDGLIDPDGGKRDLTLKRIRCNRNPDDVFNEDPLRILRAIRFSSKMGFTITKTVKKSIHKNKDLLKRCSPERIKSELDQIMVSDSIGNVMNEFFDVFKTIIPELGIMEGYDQKNHHHPHDLLTHTINVISHVRGDVNLRYAALFHDIGKPYAMSEKQNTDGEVERHFYGHEQISHSMTIDILKRLSFSKRSIDTISTIVLFHDYELSETKKSIKKYLSKFYPEKYEIAYLTLELMESDKSDTISGRREDYGKLREMMDEVIKENACMTIQELKVDGYDLIDNFNIHGKIIKTVLQKLLKLVIEEDLENEKETLLNAVRNNDIKLEGKYLEELDSGLLKQGEKGTDGKQA